MTLLKKAIITGICAIFSMTAFAEVSEVTFTDVDEHKWYAEDISVAYGHGLLAGTDENRFSPEDGITLSQAITLASRANALYFDKAIDSDSDGVWYAPYIEYAEKNGITKKGEFSDFDAKAKREDIALIFSRCLPSEFYTKINNITKIPDGDEKSSYYNALITLYNAGILTGSDEYGNFRPKDNITRAEVTAIMNRTLFPERRVSFDTKAYSTDEAYILCYQEKGMNGQKEGISSGWQYDNRAGIPKTGYDIDYNSLVDAKTDSSVAMIREFNNTDTGVVNLETEIFLNDNAFDGFVLEYQNKDREPIYRLYTDNDRFYVDTDKGPVDISGYARKLATFTLNVDIDLDNGLSRTAIDKKFLGEYGLCTEKADTNIQRLILGTTEEDMTIVRLSNTYITVNYGFYDLFETGKDGKLPYGWQGVGASNSNGTLDIASEGYASRSFKPVSGVVAANTEFNLTSGQEIEVLLLSDGKAVAKFSADSTRFMFGGKTVYENYVHDMWYRLRIEADTFNDKAKVWINGRTVATLPLENSVSYIDEMRINNLSDSKVSFDVINVFERKEQPDYVPEPVKPKGEEEYLIGMNICSLWKNGEHYGWACISPYDDREPVLGYYDEGNPETADWEIKFMVEHGIDFQAFCWYADQSNAPMKKMHLSPHLYDGYMYSKYSDRMKYCLIWEAANAQAPKDLNAWNKYYVPYFIENFFKDDRYLVIDNRLVLSVFGATKLVEKIGGSRALLKQMFDSLEEEVKKLGFDGMIYLACGSASAAVEEMGFDGVHAYGWGNSGYQVSVNKNSITNSASYKGNVHTIPTVSVGFNSIPWHNIRYPIMTAEDFETAHKWVRDEYLPNNTQKGTWQEKFVWLSTWNEYGEGTYIMPCEGNNGFGYLDALKKVYSDEKGECTCDVRPTEAQKRRINRLYPQHHRILRKEGYYKEALDSSNLQNTHTIDYSKNNGNISYNNIKDAKFTANGFYGIMNGDGIVSAINQNIDAEYAPIVAVTVDGKVGTKVEVFFITDSDSKWTQDKSGFFYIEEEGMRTSYIDMSLNNAWKGKVTAVRIDVGQCAQGTGTADKHAFTLKKADFMHKDTHSKYIVINDQRFEMQLPYVITDSGNYYFAFDPKVGFDYRLGMFMEWDYFTKTLTLDNGMHNAIFTAGKDTFIFDGKETDMSYTLTLFDGLPLFDVVQFCEAFDFDYSLNDKDEVEIYTHEYDYYCNLQNKNEAVWDFETPGNNEGWTSGNMLLFTYGGYLRMETTSFTNDPIMSLKGSIALTAEKYKKLKIRCRYKYDASRRQDIAIYYTTEKFTIMSEDTGFRIGLPNVDSGGNWVEVSFDLTTEENWNGTITSLRFDPFPTTGYMEVDYIRFE